MIIIVSVLIAFLLSLPTAHAIAGGKPLRVCPARLAEMVAKEAGVPVRSLDPVATGSTSLTTYEDAMRNNLRVLQEVLGK